MMAAYAFSSDRDVVTAEATRTFAAEVRALVESFAIRSRDAFDLFGDSHESTPSSADASDGDGILSADAREELADLLYSTLHCRETPSGLGAIMTPRTREVDESSFVQLLSQANTGAGTWQEGWQVVADEADGFFCVQQDGIRLWATRDELAAASPLTPGAICRLRFPKECLALYPGHYVAEGDAYTGGREDTIRLYWNVRAEGAARLMADVTGRFNKASIGFQLKTLSNSEAYERADAAILYMPRHEWSRARDTVAAIHAEIAPWLRPDVSLYALRLAPGLSLAEDPIEHVSFGEQRSRILASALVAAHDAPDRFASVIAVIEGEGLDVRHFYLNPGSHEVYRAL